jgi:hypothetical protein
MPSHARLLPLELKSTSFFQNNVDIANILNVLSHNSLLRYLHMVAIDWRLITLDMMEAWRCRSCLTDGSILLTIYSTSVLPFREHSL